MQVELISCFVDRETIVFSKDRVVLPRGFRLSLRSAPALPDQRKPVPQVASAAESKAVPEPPVPQVEAPPADSPVFRTDRSAVVVDAIVTDRKGRPVAGLSSLDFSV